MCMCESVNDSKWCCFRLNKRKCNFNYIIKIEFRFRFVGRTKRRKKKKNRQSTAFENPFYLHNSRKCEAKITNYYIPLKIQWKANFSIQQTPRNIFINLLERETVNANRHTAKENKLIPAFPWNINSKIYRYFVILVHK